MHPLKGRVENGPIKIDEPTDFLGGGDDAERAALHESIREGIADMEAGRTVDAKTAIAGLRSRP